MSTRLISFFSFFCCLGLTFHMAQALAVDPAEIEKALKGDGAVGWIHGAVAERNLYVFTFRNPENFFDYLEMSLTTDDAKVASKLKTLSRHDKVRIKGEFLDNPSPQKHIDAKSVELLEKFQNPISAEPYEHTAKLPEELLQKSQAVFLVHAIGAGGSILVVEYKDQIVPIYVKNPGLTQSLSRNDVVEIAYRIQKDPDRPTHLRIDEGAATPVKVVESIASLHGKPADFEGALILFPKSPEIIFNVFAIEQIVEPTSNGLKRQFTLVNFEDPKAFARIRQKLQAAWDRHPSDYVNARNKFLSLKVRVRAHGVFNQIDANQANPQILLKDESSVEILEN